MKIKYPLLCIALACLASIHQAAAQGTAFTYQGQMSDSGSPANGNYDFTFALFDAATSGNPVGGIVTNLAVGVSNGLFTTTMDFGPGIFTGNALWLQIGVETNGGSGSFTLLGALQALTPTPYAIYSSGAGTAATATTATTASSVVSGSISGASIASGQVVKSLNGLMDAVSLAPGLNVTITPSGNTLTIASSGGGGGNNWSLTGNSGTTAGIDFLGTTDNQPLELHVNGTRGMRVEPTVNDANHAGIVNVVNGASGNFATAGVYGATISGGGAGYYLSFYGTNSVTADYGTVGGGIGNTANSQESTVAGGQGNYANGFGSFVGGGFYNQSVGPSTTVGGGYFNAAGAQLSAVGGGSYNQASGFGSFIGGGGFDGVSFSGNSASFPATTVAGGLGNSAANIYATVCGGVSNTASGPGAFVGGGGYDGLSFSANTASGTSSTVAGGFGNTASAYGTVGGGFHNTSFQYAMVGGGSYNSSGGGYATVGGGSQNMASGELSFVGGGAGNQATGPGSFVGGGGYTGSLNGGNTASGGASSVGGGYGNEASGNYATVGGGSNNIITATGTWAAIPGGAGNSAKGVSSFAAGQNSTANYNNTFVWGDGTREAADQAPNSFNLLATGGVYIYNNSSNNNHVYLSPGAASWASVSDRDEKKNFRAINTVDLLDKLATIPIQRWNYKGEADDAVPHIGPMAQDFKAAFYPGRDDKGITTLEFDGVELAAIQGLNEKLERESREKDAAIQCLKEKVDELGKMVQILAEKK